MQEENLKRLREKINVRPGNALTAFLNHLVFLGGRKKAKDTKTTAKKRKLVSSEDEARGGNVSSTGKKGRNKVNQEKESRKGQKVIIHITLLIF